MTAAFVTLTWVLPNAALALLWCAVWGAGAWSTQTPQQHRLLSLHPDKGSIVVALQSSAHYSGSAAGAAVGGLALGAGVSLTQLPTLAGLTLAVALIGQLVIAVWSRSSDRSRTDYRQPQPAPVREAVEGEPL
jgi:predicted MFS family arabinose efflux permease